MYIIHIIFIIHYLSTLCKKMYIFHIIYIIHHLESFCDITHIILIIQQLGTLSILFISPFWVNCEPSVFSLQLLHRFVSIPVMPTIYP